MKNQWLGWKFPCFLEYLLTESLFQETRSMRRPRSSVTELLRHATQGPVSHHQCHTQDKNSPCWKSGWIRVLVKATMGWDDPVSLPTGLPPYLSFSLILYYTSQADQSLEAYIQTRKGHQAMWCQEGQDSSFLALSMIDSTCLPLLVQANFLELRL